MSKLDEKVATYTAALEKMGHKADAALLRSVPKACGPSIYNKHAETVASSSEKELETVKNNFLIKKLGLAAGPKLDEAISKVVDDFGSSNKNKYRAVFYYLLAKHFKKESMFK